MEATVVACGSEKGREEYQRWLADHPLYNIWRGMIRRCEDPKAHGYEYYGARGIYVSTDRHVAAVLWRDIADLLGGKP